MWTVILYNFICFDFFYCGEVNCQKKSVWEILDTCRFLTFVLGTPLPERDQAIKFTPAVCVRTPTGSQPAPTSFLGSPHFS